MVLSCEWLVSQTKSGEIRVFKYCSSDKYRFYKHENYKIFPYYRNSMEFQIRSHEDVENKNHKLTSISNYYDEHT